ncbi:MAG: GNAT family N-acetyltransferase [Thermoproteota archaeon]|nr:GNAT family N-acetyltransferase [Thermoproteota archaeon]
MIIRRYVEKDLAELVRLLNETRKNSYEFIPYTEEKFAAEIKKGRAAVLVAEDGEIAGFAMLYRGVHGNEIRWLCVKPTPERKKIEDLLVQEIEKEANSEEVFAVVDSKNPEMTNWIERGYTVSGGLYHMIAKLKRPQPIPPVPEGVTLRSLAKDEEKALVEVVNASFERERIQLGVLQKWKSRDPLFNEEWVHVAELNKQIISVVVSRRALEYNQYYGGKRGYLGPAATLPVHRCKGLAKALTCRAMNYLLRKGMESVSLYTSERNLPSVALLKSLSFKTKCNWKFLRKNLAETQEKCG